MFLITQSDLEQFVMENYFTFLLLGGLLIVMYAYRDVRLPAGRNFQRIINVLFLMGIANSLENWACASPDRINFRIAASVIHYILQPLVFYLELVIIMPSDDSNSRQRQKTLFIPALINTIVYLMAPFTGRLVFSYNDQYYFNSGPLGCTIYITTFIYLVLLLMWTFRFLHTDRRQGIILFFISGIAVLTGLLEYTNFAHGFIDEAFALGVFLYYMYLVTVHESQMQTSLARQEAELSRKELELSQNKVNLLRQQIRPHFIFNSLHIIKSLIRTDQDKAVSSLEDFSDYLRANFEAIASDHLISFEDELTHTGTYLSLALADESKNINVEYDLQEKDFRLPPLTVEPMVENAVRHGLRDGGAVTISTRRDRDDIVITIADDGIGFEQGESGATEKEKSRIGIGIENVRTRIATLCSGTLDINSSDEGTVVTIRIPVVL